MSLSVKKNAPAKQAVKEAEKVVDYEEKIKSFRDYQISILDDYPDPVPLVKQGDRILLSRGNIVNITGKPKAFKTFVQSIIISAFMEDETLSLSGCGGTCLLADTEQSKSHVNLVQKRIYKLSGWPKTKINDKLTVLSLRELSPSERLKNILEAIEDLKPDLVIIDGIRDLCYDFNDLKESAELVGKLMTVSTKYDCGIITILHQNKADTNARGHLGSELNSKTESVLQVINDCGIATVEPVYSRNREIEPFSFRINENGLPEGCALPKVQAKTDQLRVLLEKVMFGQSWISRADLAKKLALYEGKTERTASRKINEALKKEILRVNEAGFLILNKKTDTNEDLLF